ncbi:MAG: S-methyl-5-thioribose-1-phosphate isomerase [Methylotenera sp.]
MRVNAQHFRTIWPDARCKFVNIIDQTKLPFVFETVRLESLEQMVHSIKTMQVRGAPLIGVAAAYGMALATLHDDSDDYLQQAGRELVSTRPTAVNLRWAVQRMQTHLLALQPNQRNFAAWKEAAAIAEEDVSQNKLIGQHGLGLIKNLYENKTLNILTHCNAGWLATVDFGTALAPIYTAHDAGLSVHVWVSETRPRNQGAALTAWELAQHGVPHTVITDNAGGHLMQQGNVDMVIVGADRVTSAGGVCNKIGTYLKALAAHDNKVPFYAAVPSPTIDWDIAEASIEIEHRHADELAYMTGLSQDGSMQTIRVMHEGVSVINPAFDVTPAKFVTGIITERGVFAPADLKSVKG